VHTYILQVSGTWILQQEHHKRIQIATSPSFYRTTHTPISHLHIRIRTFVLGQRNNSRERETLFLEGGFLEGRKVMEPFWFCMSAAQHANKQKQRSFSWLEGMRRNSCWQNVCSREDAYNSLCLSIWQFTFLLSSSTRRNVVGESS